VSKTRHIPERSCVVCREVRPKPELNRLVRGPDGTLAYDATGKAPGRGAYVCAGCLGRDIKRERLEQALRGKIDTADLARVRAALMDLAPSQ
jgi:predicted RNA-binding protein YlxR (DUF448 family)